MTKAKILIVDDEESNVKLLNRLLTKAGYAEIVATVDSREALPLFTQFEPDLVLLDLNMPHPNGFEVLEQLKEVIPPDTYLPILILIGDINPQAKQKALAGGAKDFLIKPFDAMEVLLRIENLIETRFLHKAIRAHSQDLEHRVQEALRELKNAQSQVIQQERMHALGLMARGVAHDFNNTLAVILGFGELVLQEMRRFPQLEEASKSMEIIITAATDASQIVDRLREFHRSAGEHHVQVPIDLNLLVEQAVSFTKPRWENDSIGKDIAILTENCAGESALVLGDPAELREVLVNLIFNSIDAMPHGGTITLRTRKEADKILVDVSDTGTGMTEEVRNRCLEPFFTTKGDRGTGLGLAMVYGILHRHSGVVTLESELGKGTTFTLKFPAYTGSAQQVELNTAILESSLHILIADGHPILCDIAAQYLHGDGHTIERVANGMDALEKFKHGSFDLVITGQSMPGLNGEQLANGIKAICPEMPVIMLTGFAKDAEERPPGVDLMLGKPISRKALRHAMAQVLNSRVGAR